MDTSTLVARAAAHHPPDLYYLVAHQVWAQPHGDGTARVGITALGVALSGDIYMCRPKRVGVQVQQGGALAVVELAKSIVSVKSPVSGVVQQVNPLLQEQPELVCQDPYGQGWLAQLQLTHWQLEQQLLVYGHAVHAAMQQHAWLYRSGGDGV